MGLGDQPNPQIMTHPRQVSHRSQKQLFLSKLFFFGFPVTYYRRNADRQPGSLGGLRTSWLLWGTEGGDRHRRTGMGQDKGVTPNKGLKEERSEQAGMRQTYLLSPA